MAVDEVEGETGVLPLLVRVNSDHDPLFTLCSPAAPVFTCVSAPRPVMFVFV